MKRLLTSGLVLLAMAGATASFAQGKRTYDDDIYYNSKDAAKQAKQEPTQARPAQRNTGSDDTYTSSGNNYDSRNNERRYDDDYVDYDDESSYSTQINRFNYPFYNRPYWSSFYNPGWYDPFWVDPYWGWNPWARPGFSVSFGGGPYWSSYWGWQSWYGCGGFNSYYGNPGFGMYGGYYSGFWNGYYAGLYNNNYGYGIGGRYRPITYGPRYSMDATRNNYVSNVGHRGFRREVRTNTTQVAPQSELSTPRTNTGLRTLNNSTNAPVRDRAVSTESSTGAVRDIRSNSVESIDRNHAPIRSSDATISRDRDFGEIRSIDRGSSPRVEEATPRGNRWNDAGAGRSEQMSAPAQPGRERNSWFGGRGEAPVRSVEPRVEQQRTFSQPRSERSAPVQRMEAPSRNSGGNGGGRSFGGGNNGGGVRGGRR